MKFIFGNLLIFIATFSTGIFAPSSINLIEDNFLLGKEIKDSQTSMRQLFEKDDAFASFCEISKNPELFENKIIKIREDNLIGLYVVISHTRYGRVVITTKCFEKEFTIPIEIENEKDIFLRDSDPNVFDSPQNFEIKFVGTIKSEAKFWKDSIGFRVMADSITVEKKTINN